MGEWQNRWALAHCQTPGRGGMETLACTATGHLHAVKARGQLGRSDGSSLFKLTAVMAIDKLV